MTLEHLGEIRREQIAGYGAQADADAEKIIADLAMSTGVAPEHVRTLLILRAGATDGYALHDAISAEGWRRALDVEITGASSDD